MKCKFDITLHCVISSTIQITENRYFCLNSAAVLLIIQSLWLDHLGWWSKPWMEKEGGAEYWGFMSPFGNRFVRYICLLALHEPLFQSLLLLVTKLKVELTIKTKAPNSISICKTKKWSLFLPKCKPLLCFFFSRRWRNKSTPVWYFLTLWNRMLMSMSFTRWDNKSTPF